MHHHTLIFTRFKNQLSVISWQLGAHDNLLSPGFVEHLKLLPSGTFLKIICSSEWTDILAVEQNAVFGNRQSRIQ